MRTLEQRYRRLLLAYPADYRAERGEEILGTLMEVARPDQRRPTLRERRSLIMGGVRIRLAAQHRLSAAMNWRLVVMLSGVLMLGLFPQLNFGWEGLRSDSLSARVGESDGWHWSFYVDWPTLIAGLAVMAVVVSLWFAPPRILLALAAVAAIAGVLVNSCVESFINAGILLALALLRIGAQRMPRPWLGFYAIAVLGNAIPSLLPHGNSGISPIALIAIGIGALAWAAVDARPFLAVTLTILITITIATTAASLDGHGSAGPTLLTTYLLSIGAAVLLGVPAARRLRRQSAL